MAWKRRTLALIAASLAILGLTLLAVAALGSRHTHSSLWRQLSAFIEAFGGLLGVGLLELCALALVLLVDRWISAPASATAQARAKEGRSTPDNTLAGPGSRG